MSRRTDRKHTFKLVFQLGFRSICFDESPSEEFDLSCTECLDMYYESIGEKEAASLDREFIRNEFCGAVTRLSEIDGFIEKHSEGWVISRIAKADLAILRLCIYEFMFGSIPESASINEAVELAKEFSSDDAPSFVNGLLGKIASAEKA